MSGRSPRCPGSPLALWDRRVGRPRGKDTPRCPRTWAAGLPSPHSGLPVWGMGRRVHTEGSPRPSRGSVLGSEAAEGAGAGGVDRSNGSHPSTFPEAWRRQAQFTRPIRPSFPFYLSANCTQGILHLTQLTEKLTWKGGLGREAHGYSHSVPPRLCVQEVPSGAGHHPKAYVFCRAAQKGHSLLKPRGTRPCAPAHDPQGSHSRRPGGQADSDTGGKPA